MIVFARGRYRARLADGEADLAAALRLRALTYRSAACACDNEQGQDGTGQDGTGQVDADHMDPLCDHMLVEDVTSGDLVCCFRMLSLNRGTEIGRSYAARYYDLDSLRAYPGPMIEMGRFCVAEGHGDPDILRVAWGATTSCVDRDGVQMLFGCSSFQGTETAAYLDAFALLKDRHLAPSRWQPKIKSSRVFPFARHLGTARPDMKKAAQHMPPLLRTYLLMGGWVSDHAVVDADLNTLHVFTGVEIARVPPARARMLRAM